MFYNNEQRDISYRILRVNYFSLIMNDTFLSGWFSLHVTDYT